MTTEPNVEYWLAGSIDGIIPLLQPAAHAMLQSRKEIREVLRDFPEKLLWQTPAGVASVAFHLQHIPGFIDRLFTYASDQSLSGSQMEYLQSEGKMDPDVNLEKLLHRLSDGVDKAIGLLKAMPVELVLETRWVGRKRIPSNVLSLVFHAAVHMQRHTGQLLVTAKVLQNGDN